jgi:diguanylate cyclase (GGDEF)-like protein
VLKKTSPSARIRLREDYQLSLVSLVAALTVVVVTPFAVVRFVQGFILVGVIDTVVVAAGAFAGVYAWLSGKTRVPSIIISIILPIAVIMLAYVLGVLGAIWVFPVILFVFYLVPPLFALAVMAVTITSFVAQEFLTTWSIFGSPLEMISFFSALLIAAVFSFVFAVRANRQREQLTRWAIRDSLTGLYNRRHLDEELQIALANRERHGTGYGLLIFDVDHFKDINDRGGHATGDRLLRELAALIREMIRTSDRAFRYGGDEFVILCPETDLPGLMRIADTLVASVPRRIQWNGTPVSISLGGATLRPDDSRDSWNTRADRRLYHAKDRGRNRAVVDR